MYIEPTMNERGLHPPPLGREERSDDLADASATGERWR
jgi:hypothetical protein